MHKPCSFFITVSSSTILPPAHQNVEILQKPSFIVTSFKPVNCSHQEQFTADSGFGDIHLSNNHQSRRTTLGEYHGWWNTSTLIFLEGGLYGTALHSQYTQCAEEFSAFGQNTTYFWNACHSTEGKDIYQKGGKKHFIQNKLNQLSKQININLQDKLKYIYTKPGCWDVEQPTTMKTDHFWILGINTLIPNIANRRGRRPKALHSSTFKQLQFPFHLSLSLFISKVQRNEHQHEHKQEITIMFNSPFYILTSSLRM